MSQNNEKIIIERRFVRLDNGMIIDTSDAPFEGFYYMLLVEHGKDKDYIVYCTNKMKPLGYLKAMSDRVENLICDFDLVRFTKSLSIIEVPPHSVKGVDRMDFPRMSFWSTGFSYHLSDFGAIYMPDELGYRLIAHRSYENPDKWVFLVNKSHIERTY